MGYAQIGVVMIRRIPGYRKRADVLNGNDHPHRGPKNTIVKNTSVVRRVLYNGFLRLGMTTLEHESGTLFGLPASTTNNIKGRYYRFLLGVMLFINLSSRVRGNRTVLIFYRAWTAPRLLRGRNRQLNETRRRRDIRLKSVRTLIMGIRRGRGARLPKGRPLLNNITLLIEEITNRYRE